MEIFNIGTAEFFVILFLALMILGPRRLPEYAAKAGKLVRDLRNMSQGFMIEWQRELRVAARLEEFEEARRELEETQRLLRDTQREITTETSQIAAEATSAATAATKAAAERSPIPTETSKTVASTSEAISEPTTDKSDEETPPELTRSIRPPASQPNGASVDSIQNGEVSDEVALDAPHFEGHQDEASADDQVSEDKNSSTDTASSEVTHE